MDIGSVYYGGWQSLARILFVGVPIYALLLALLHYTGKHSLAKNNAYGLVVTVSLGSALASAVLTKQVTFADAGLAIGLLLGLQYLLSTAATRSARAEQALTERPTLLLLHGELRRETLRRERVTEAEVRAAVRQRGGDSLQSVGAVVLEADGTLSVIFTIGTAPTALADVEGLAPGPSA